MIHLAIATASCSTVQQGMGILGWEEEAGRIRIGSAALRNTVEASLLGREAETVQQQLLRAKGVLRAPAVFMQRPTRFTCLPRPSIIVMIRVTNEIMTAIT
ncbi:hypothetical protein OPV22_001600 [Ensete ventricosum]|uniref:Uncharacterized protein n=1 Tax=Ensete ventricosum TaxID=4639 RepID=A0AAV8RSK0_ENSVE|nr:hypothetical protein OPV22_001600 [Ensete ventricosum]